MGLMDHHWLQPLQEDLNDALEEAKDGGINFEDCGTSQIINALVGVGRPRLGLCVFLCNTEKITKQTPPQQIGDLQETQKDELSSAEHALHAIERQVELEQQGNATNPNTDDDTEFESDDDIAMFQHGVTDKDVFALLLPYEGEQSPEKQLGQSSTIEKALAATGCWRPVVRWLSKQKLYDRAALTALHRDSMLSNSSEGGPSFSSLELSPWMKARRQHLAALGKDSEGFVRAFRPAPRSPTAAGSRSPTSNSSPIANTTPSKQFAPTIGVVFAANAGLFSLAADLCYIYRDCLPNASGIQQACSLAGLAASLKMFGEGQHHKSKELAESAGNSFVNLELMGAACEAFQLAEQFEQAEQIAEEHCPEKLAGVKAAHSVFSEQRGQSLDTIKGSEAQPDNGSKNKSNKIGDVSSLDRSSPGSDSPESTPSSNVTAAKGVRRAVFPRPGGSGVDAPSPPPGVTPPQPKPDGDNFESQGEIAPSPPEDQNGIVDTPEQKSKAGQKRDNDGVDRASLSMESSSGALSSSWKEIEDLLLAGSSNALQGRGMSSNVADGLILACEKAQAEFPTKTNRVCSAASKALLKAGKENHAWQAWVAGGNIEQAFKTARKVNASMEDLVRLNSLANGKYDAYIQERRKRALETEALDPSAAVNQVDGKTLPRPPPRIGFRHRFVRLRFGYAILAVGAAVVSLLLGPNIHPDPWSLAVQSVALPGILSPLLLAWTLHERKSYMNQVASSPWLLAAACVCLSAASTIWSLAWAITDTETSLNSSTMSGVADTDAVYNYQPVGSRLPFWFGIAESLAVGGIAFICIGLSNGWSTIVLLGAAVGFPIVWFRAKSELGVALLPLVLVPNVSTRGYQAMLSGPMLVLVVPWVLLPCGLRLIEQAMPSIGLEVLRWALYTAPGSLMLSQSVFSLPKRVELDDDEDQEKNGNGERHNENFEGVQTGFERHSEVVSSDPQGGLWRGSDVEMSGAGVQIGARSQPGSNLEPAAPMPQIPRPTRPG